MRSVLVIVSLSALTACTPPPQWAGADTAISGIHIIDPVDGTVRRDHMVLIKAGEVLAVAPSDPERLPSKVQHIEGGGAYATPGLWDAHVHALGDVDIALARTLPAFIAYGVTHVRDMGASLDRLQAVRSMLAAEPDRLAPRILASGPLLVERELQWYGDLQYPVGEGNSIEKVVAELSITVDFLKAYTGLSATSYAALTSEAARLGLPVDGHVPDSVGIDGAVNAGQRTIEHLDLSAFLTCHGGPQGPFGNWLAVRFGEGMEAYVQLAGKFWSTMDWSECGPALDVFAARGGAVTPTLSMELRDRSRISQDALAQISPTNLRWCEQGLAELDSVDAESLSLYYQGLFHALRSLDQRGVVLLAGTDTPNHCSAPGSSLAGELERLAEAGLSSLAVLQTATTNPGRVLGVEDAGIAPGQRADLVLFSENPLQDVTTYRDPIGVYTQGRWVSRGDLGRIRSDLAHASE